MFSSLLVSARHFLVGGMLQIHITQLVASRLA